MKRLTLPLSDSDIKNLKAGETVLLSGTMLTGRDAAHKRLYELVEKGEKLPIDIKGELIYYVGPAPAKPGFAVGPAGPTSSYIMDKYAPTLLDLVLKGMIGKGAVEAIGRQPSAAGDIRTSMLIMGALIEGVALFAIVVCFLALFQ